ncbi:MAG: GbsR/MarR family transcriptional regulator [Planctomycetota bacterium]|jgi:DNA-binding transcriptional regulator GbsR (MarR family)
MPILSPAKQQFILHWGEMGQKWGVNRSVAQIHALLFLADAPLPAEDIAETLSLARSNVSTSLKELQGWHIVRLVHVMGDRRDHFESLTDVWEMFQIVLDERKRREIDPTMRVLRECLEQVNGTSSADRRVRERLQAMLDFFETMSSWYQQIRRLPQGAVIKFVKMGSKVQKLFGRSGSRRAAG